MKKKDARAARPTKNPQTVVAATSEEEDTSTAETVAAVKDTKNKTELMRRLTVIRVVGDTCKLAALIDIGSPVSFI